ncbi:methylated-DNA--[protein]-cysteine S-methyltransferase [Cohnella faecalis]|uniref:methylated-DNA--[protein]-cysteine S-methyltransferase n=1 Tax=Cohnella faecalis TaxID=2315694 RepID=A0A398CNS1_9BACL|nr:methylated-DNA--[protein]-cysteine S-methyltransferase [Cohnella faecalis]RIE03982.1 methylated-DNA--[protein]-cysteine S-methyltransferase [Cohnella faecalis]
MEKNAKPNIYWSLLVHDDWSVYIAATEEGLCFVGSHSRAFDELENWSNARFPGSALIRNDEKLQPFAAELIGYWKGTRTSFGISFDLRGTPFQLAVWNALLEIPHGQTSSYSDIARRIQKPAAVRAVGAAIGANPVLIAVPCHRVIGKNGALTGYRGGMDMKTRLLGLERDGADDGHSLGIIFHDAK